MRAPECTSRITSRREFLGRSLTALAAGPFVLAGSRRARAAERERGTITLDGLLFTYFPSPIGSNAAARWHVSSSVDYTVRLIAGAGVSLTGAPPQDARRVGGFRQSRAKALAGGLIVRHRSKPGGIQEIETGKPGSPDRTVFYGLLRPRFQVRETDADSGGRVLKFWLDEASSTFTLTRASLWSDASVRERFGAGTIDSYLAAYRFDPSELEGDRFQFRQRTLGPREMSIEEPGVRVDPIASATTAARIVEQAGFASAELQAAFAPGTLVTIEHSSLQRGSKRPITAVEAAIETTTNIHWDRAFKTYIFSESSGA